MKLPSVDSATGRAIRAACFALFSFFIGLVVAVYNVPGVPEAVSSYLQSHIDELFLAVGIPVALGTGAMSFVFNYLRPNVKNY